MLLLKKEKKKHKTLLEGEQLMMRVSSRVSSLEKFYEIEAVASKWVPATSKGYLATRF